MQTFNPQTITREATVLQSGSGPQPERPRLWTQLPGLQRGPATHLAFMTLVDFPERQCSYL